MFLIVGLGNPGPKYKNTPHNLGFEVVEIFQKENGFPNFKMKKKLKAEVSQGTVDDKKVLLAKPQTFMNKSGQSVKALTKNYQLKTTNLIIVHDDLDLPPGKIKISFGKSSGGHKGVKSIIKELDSKKFYRLRIGTASLRMSDIRKHDIRKHYVLKKFTQQQQKIVNQAITTACRALKPAIVESPQKAMTRFN